MIRISKPRIEKNDNTTFLLSEVYDEVRNLRMDVWFSVDSTWGGDTCAMSMLTVFYYCCCQ